MIETDVLIVGGGATGLTASMLLSTYGVDSLLVSRYPQTSRLPKAHVLSIKTMEVFREAGVEAAIRERSAPAKALCYVAWFAGLDGPDPDHGREIARMGAWGRGGEDLSWRQVSDVLGANLTQAQLEPLLRTRSEQLAPGRVRFAHELQSFAQEHDRVLATVVDRGSGEQYDVHARYLLGCDGGRQLAEQLGVTMDGHDSVATTISVHFTADLSQTRGAHDTDDVLNRTIFNPDAGDPGVLVPMGPDHWGGDSREWVLSLIAQPGEHKHDDDEHVIDKLRALLGIGELPLEVHQITRWPLNAVVASSFRVGQVFLLGDAAHRMPPAGGHGLNTAVQDSHNLCWKLAEVTAGRAGDGLLDSYESERRPVALQTVQSAYENWQNAWRIGAAFGFSPKQSPEQNWRNLRLQWTDGPDGEAARRRGAEGLATALSTYNHLRYSFGYTYREGALVPDAVPAPQALDRFGDMRPSTKPGHPLPHAWLENTRGRYSINELVGRGRFVLIAGEQGRGWCEAARNAAAQFSLPIDAFTIGVHDADHLDLRCEWLAQREIGPRGAVLVRPDRFVAWRAMDASADPELDLCTALTTILHCP